MIPQSAPPQIYFVRPMIDLCAVQSALDRSREQVWPLVKDGTLRAFNLAGEVFYSRSSLRFIAADVATFQRGASKPPRDFQTCLHAIFPLAPTPRFGVVAKIGAGIVARQLNLKTDRIYGLVNAGLLRLVPGSCPRLGPGGFADLEWVSVVEFLRKRRL